ncbi:riboflavin synthase [Candidatus Desantisbacteria bacterium]|nr:riboflavin synthase [Candidatus Desantisbacteria bacterium]
MFTGIIEEVGKIKKIEYDGEGRKLIVEAHKIMSDIKQGESIALDGVCLTVESWGKDFFVVYVMPETMKKTGFLNLKVGQLINLEKALPLNGRLGGHFVQGHVDTTGTITQIIPDSKAKIIKISIPFEWNKYLVPKGSISINGISLTIIEAEKDFFTVSIIPHTQNITNIGNKKIHDTVNIEFDILAKHIVKLVTPMVSSGLTLDKIKEMGIR